MAGVWYSLIHNAKQLVDPDLTCSKVNYIINNNNSVTLSTQSIQ